MRFVSASVALLNIACSCAHAGAVARLAAALPDIGPPPQGEVRWIARSMRMNGMPMTLKVIQTRLSPTELFSFYEASMRGQADTELRRSTMGEWQLLSIKSADHYATIQVRPVIAGSEGTIAVTASPEQATQKLSSEFPRPLTTRIVGLQEYDDAGIESEHISFSSRRTVTMEARAFQQELERQGWQITKQQATRSLVGRGVVIEAQHGAQQALLTLLPDAMHPSTTAIVVVWRKS
jgi:hypothetical protein